MRHTGGPRWMPDDPERDPSETQVLRPSADNRETRTFARPGDTRQIPPLTLATPDVNPPEYDIRKRSKMREKAAPQPYTPGIVMRVFSRALGVMFAGFCLGIIGITFGFILWKYYNHLFH